MKNTIPTTEYFANMRGYLSDSEMEQLNKESLENIRKADPVVAKFMEKYGVDKTEWSDDVVNEYECDFYNSSSTWYKPEYFQYGNYGIDM